MNLFSKFKNKLRKTSDMLSSSILNSFKNKKVDDETIEELATIKDYQITKNDEVIKTGIPHYDLTPNGIRILYNHINVK